MYVIICFLFKQKKEVLSSKNEQYISGKGVRKKQGSEKGGRAKPLRMD